MVGGDVVDRDLRLVEPANRVRDRARRTGDRKRDRAVVQHGRARSDGREHLGGRRRQRLVCQANLEPVSAHLTLELVRRAFGDHLAVVDDRDPVREAVGLLQVLRRQQDGRPAADEALDRLPEREPAAEVEAGRRLVEEEDRRPGDERRRQVEPATHAAGIRPHQPLAGVREPELVEQLGRPLP